MKCKSCGKYRIKTTIIDTWIGTYIVVTACMSCAASTTTVKRVNDYK